MGEPQGSMGAEFVMPHWATHIVEDVTGPQAVMAVAHLLAAAALGWWLASGERALWALVCLTGHAADAYMVERLVRPLTLLAATRNPIEPITGPLPGAFRFPAGPSGFIVNGSTWRRGPPVLAA